MEFTTLWGLGKYHGNKTVASVGRTSTQSEELPEVGPLVAIRSLWIFFLHSCARRIRAATYNENWVGASGVCPFGDLSPRYDITETKLQQATGQACHVPSAALMQERGIVFMALRLELVVP